MKKLWTDRTGSTSIIFIGLVFFLLLISMLIMEMGAVYENYYDAETILQRCCNSAVEKNMSDAYRADNILYLDVQGATADFNSYLSSNMPDKYTLTVKSVTGTATPPSLTVTGTVTFSTLFHQYGFDDITFDFTVKSTNYRTEGSVDT
jgi:Flp pilus assembly protein TadG